MKDNSDVSPIESILTLAHEIIDECPSCAAKASRIAMWASEIRERRPGAEELAALIDATCDGTLSEIQRDALINSLRVLVRFAG
ncbi:hypothetical protein [Microvirga massiliensis]|uniref:hypothetical protein n=1 Tax=Microvirga massiliensis TaxID=1033741 RepID=UPI00062B85E0|nr:hypothetical protein [Microvirga massiliensis]